MGEGDGDAAESLGPFSAGGCSGPSALLQAGGHLSSAVAFIGLGVSWQVPRQKGEEILLWLE